MISNFNAFATAKGISTDQVNGRGGRLLGRGLLALAVLCGHDLEGVFYGVEGRKE